MAAAAQHVEAITRWLPMTHRAVEIARLSKRNGCAQIRISSIRDGSRHMGRRWRGHAASWRRISRTHQLSSEVVTAHWQYRDSRV